MVATIASLVSFAWGLAQVQAYILFPVDRPEVVGDLNVVPRTLVLTLHSMSHKYGLSFLFYYACFLSFLVIILPDEHSIRFVRESLLKLLTFATCMAYPLILNNTLIDNATKITPDEVYYLQLFGRHVFFLFIHLYIGILTACWRPRGKIFSYFLHFARTWNLLAIAFVVNIEGGAIQLNKIGM